MSTDTLILTPAAELLPGDRLDLEGDEYACTFDADERLDDPANAQRYADHVSTVSTFQFEYAVVESIERETERCVVVHTSLTSFGCPPDHRLRRKPADWTVGVTATCQRLGRFGTHDEAAEFIETLPGYQGGIYYLDGPGCETESEDE
jgi:hypothetical protein